MIAASSFRSPLPPLNGLSRISHRSKASFVVRARFQRCQNEDGPFETRKASESLVDRNMGLLRERMEVVKKRESLQKWHTTSEWEYLLKCDEDVVSGKKETNQLLQNSEVVARSFVLAVLSSTLCLCLASVATHMAG